MPTTDVREQVMYYETIGQGRPLLLMHGWTNIGNDLREVAEGIAAFDNQVRYQVILPDLPGYGRSVPPYRTFPPDFYRRDAELMCAFLDSLDVFDAHIMGFSDGGEVALLMPILRPDLCRSAIAWGAIGAFGPEACERARQSGTPGWFNAELEAKHPGQDVYAWTDQWVEAFCAMIAAGGDISLSRANEIECPLLLMLGEDETLNPVTAGQHFINMAVREGVPRMFESFAGAGHAVHLEQPKAFMAKVREFLLMVEAWHR